MTTTICSASHRRAGGLLPNLVEFSSVQFPAPWFALTARLTDVDALRDAYVVGGFVRDLALGRPTHDVDVAVAGDAIAVAQRIADVLDARLVVLDVERGVARVVAADDADAWHIDVAALKGDIEADLALRDFTIDAMAIAWRDAADGRWAVLDPCDGRDDLRRRLVRATSAAALDDDPLRLLRGVRLAATLGFELEAQTARWIAERAPSIATVARERVNDELSRILAGPAAAWLGRLDELGLLTALVPELAATKGAPQPAEHYWNVFDHSIATVAAVEALLRESVDVAWLPSWAIELAPWSEAIEAHFDEAGGGGRRRRVLLKLAALLHDIAKPQTKTIEADGRVRFLGHPQQGAAVATAVMERLRFSSREVELVAAMVAQHMRPAQMAAEADGPSRRAVYRYFRDLGDAAIDTLFLSLADHLATRGPRLNRDGWRRHSDVTAELVRQQFAASAAPPPPKLADGHVVMRHFGLAPGPLVGELLERIREAQAAGEIATEAEALDLAAVELAARRPG